MHILFFTPKAIDGLLKRDIETFLSNDFPFTSIVFINDPLELREIEKLEFEILIGPTHFGMTQILDQITSIKWIHFLSAGVDPIWSYEYDFSSYFLTKSNGVHANAMAEFAIGTILFFLKGFGQFTRQQIDTTWNRFWLEELTGKKLCIIGLGEIGLKLAFYASMFGMTVSGTNTTGKLVKSPSNTSIKVFSATSISQAINDVDFIVLLAPYTKTTHHLINADTLSQMKKGAFLINLSRGGLVNEPDLINALKQGIIGGAALDVFEHEPLPGSSDLWKMENVLITPHVSGTTQDYLKKAISIFMLNLNCYINKEPLPNLVNNDSGY